MAFETLGARIAYVRGGLTQAEFAERLGVSRNTLVRYENDRRTPTAEILQILVTEFDVDANWLLLGAGKAPTTEDRRAAILMDHWQHCDDRGKDAMLATGAALAQSKSGKIKDVG